MSLTGERPTAVVYVDGFNLYRRALQSTRYKWLDLSRMSDLLLPKFDVVQVRYFTARIRMQTHKPQSPQRQQAYLRAISADPRVSMHFGQFRIDQREMQRHPLELDEAGQPILVKVRKFEEKGSDVNLATHLLSDAFQNAAAAFVVLTNDSDLAEPMRLLRHDWGKTVGLITPGHTTSKALLAAGPQIILQLREGVLQESQFPDLVRDGHGAVKRPDTW